MPLNKETKTFMCVCVCVCVWVQRERERGIYDIMIIIIGNEYSKFKSWMWLFLFFFIPLKELKILFNYFIFLNSINPVGRVCRIHHLHLWRDVKPPSPMSVLDMTLNFIWWWGFNPVRASSMGQIELFNHLLCLKIFNWTQIEPFNWVQTINSNTWNYLTVCKQ